MELKYKNICYAIRNEICAIITINRMHQRNAIDDDTTLEISSLLDDIEKDEKIRLVVITGKGTKAFSAGGDLKRIKEKTSKDIFRYNLQDLCYKIENFSLPVLALINGVAMGGGLEIALACDFRFAFEGTYMGLPETSIGLIPSAGGTQRLVKLVGETIAKEMIMLGKKIDAEQAHQIGLVNKVILENDVAEEIDKIIEIISLKSKSALTFAKWLINFSQKDNIITGMRYEKVCQALLLDGEDKREGIEAFFQKRNPRF